MVKMFLQENDVSSYPEIRNVNNSDSEQLTPCDTDEVEDSNDCFKSRHILGFMGFLGFANVYAMRVNLSVAIVAMVNNSAISQDNTSLITDVCPLSAINVTSPTKDGDFVWDEATQGIILGSFFYGYVLTQIPGGRLAELFGGKLIYGIGVLMTAIFTLLTPAAARIDYTLFLAVRILEGVSEGVTFPAMHAMLARWIPPLERSKFAAYVYAGSNFGTVISLPLSGWLCSLELWGGWPLAFYIFGWLGVVWFAFWLFLVYDTPEKHPRICPKERNYIIHSIGPQDDDDLNTSTPWGSILTCLPMWAILVTQCGMSWAFYTQLTELPTYMNNMLHFDIQSNSVLSALPYFTSWIGGIVFSVFADWCIARRYLNPKASMIVFNSIASIVPSLGLIGVAWVGCDRTAALVLLTMTGAFTGAVYAGNQMNHINLSPRYAGTMYGITNAASNTCGFLAPYFIGMLINGQETLGQWRIVFYLAAGLNMGCNIFYIAFASAEEQPWSKRPVVILR